MTAGMSFPATAVEAGPCVITQKKTVENDGYAAYQYGFGEVKVSHVNKPMAGHFKERCRSQEGLRVNSVLTAWKLNVAT